MVNKNKKLERIYQLLNETNSKFILYGKELYLKTCHKFEFDKYNNEYTVFGAVHSDRERKDQPLGYIFVRVNKDNLKSFTYTFEHSDLKLTEYSSSILITRQEPGAKDLDTV